jgi:hypothetical protein
MTTWLQTLAAPLISTLQHPLVDNIVRLSAVEDTLQALHPLLSLTQVRARVSRIVDETPDTKTFVLQPNALWAGFQAGQYVRISLEINGRQVHRAVQPVESSWRTQIGHHCQTPGGWAGVCPPARPHPCG